MSAYLWSDDMPVVLYAGDLDPLTLRVAVERWMKERSIMTFMNPSDSVDVGGPHGVVVNFGALPWVHVRADAPDGDKPVMRWDETNLENL